MTREAIKGSHPQALLKTAESSDVHQLVKKKKKSQKQDKPAGQAKQNRPPPLPLDQGLHPPLQSPVELLYSLKYQLSLAPSG